MKAFFIFLTAIVLSVSSAHGADTSKTEGKRPAARQNQKVLKPGERLAATKKYLAEKASKTAAVIRTNASRIKEAMFPDSEAATKTGGEAKPEPKAAKAAQGRRASP